MGWSGKLIGGLLGFLLTGSPLGLIIGILLGAYVEQMIKPGYFGGRSATRLEAQQAFFSATFLVMGHVAKADGRVSEREINVARAIMRRMRLTEKQKHDAMNLFNVGKQPNFNLQNVLNRLKYTCHGYRALLQLFIELQFEAALAEGSIGPNKRRILEFLCQNLGFTPIFFHRYQEAYEAGQRQQAGAGAGAGAYQQAPTDRLTDAYLLLGVNKSASSVEIKKAYRKLISQNHPDKLISKGLPEEMLRLATDKAQKIQVAYDLIKKERGF